MNKEELIDKIVGIASDNSFDGFNESCMDRNITELLKDYDLVKKNDSLPNINNNEEREPFCDTCNSGLIDYPEINRRTCRCGRLGYNVTK